MIHSLAIQRTLTYQVKIEAEDRNIAEVITRLRIINGDIPASSEDWEYIHTNGTRHFVPEGKR